jgi:hypothetical protein
VEDLQKESLISTVQKPGACAPGFFVDAVLMRFSDIITGPGWMARTYDTNNAWGFGGSTGAAYTREDVVVKVGTAYYRHLRSHGFITVTVAGKRVVDGLNVNATEDAALAALARRFPEYSTED